MLRLWMTKIAASQGRLFLTVQLFLLAHVANSEFYDPLSTLFSPEDRQFTVSEDAFRAIISAAYRVEAAKGWCYGKPQPESANGRIYDAIDYGRYVVTLMDLLIGMNMLNDRARCAQKHIVFRNEVEFELVNSTDDTALWWEERFLPMAADAFTCGYDISSTICDLQLLSDVSKSTCLDDTLVKQTWFLMKSYLTSSSKQRERSAKSAPPRRTDYDLSIYVPFIGKRLSVNNGTLARPYQADRLLRVGFPHYIGPSLWRIFHSVAMRMVDYSSCAGSQDQLVNAFKKMFLYFAVAGQPCPVCREHFLSSVSRNDVLYETVCDRERSIMGEVTYNSEKTQCSRGATAKTPALKSEVNIYPIEWVIVGCTGSTGLCQTNPAEIMKSKLDAITNVKTLNLFIWKLHNAVTASVRDGKYCSVEERYDQDLFKCNSSNEDELGKPLSRRYWPFSKRYEFSLKAKSSSSVWWNDVRNNLSIRAAVKGLMDAEQITVALRKAVASGETGSSVNIRNISRLVAALDAAVWNSGILQKVYYTSSFPAKRTCNDLKSQLGRQDTIPLPDISTITTIQSFTKCQPALSSASHPNGRNVLSLLSTIIAISLAAVHHWEFLNINI